jgi:hypothetical protein
MQHHACASIARAASNATLDNDVAGSLRRHPARHACRPATGVSYHQDVSRAARTVSRSPMAMKAPAFSVQTLHHESSALGCVARTWCCS